MRARVSWHARLVLLRPRRIRTHLERLEEQGIIPSCPTPWQLELGVLRMWHRILFRSSSIGTCLDQPVRRNWRARLLRFRLLRLPFLLVERAVAPLDHCGLAQPTSRMIRHLLAAHHDRNQFAYDLQILAGTPGALQELRDAAREVVRGRGERSRWLRDLCVFEHYHEHLLAAVEAALQGSLELAPGEEEDPDITFSGFVRWCLAQPGDPWASWRSLLRRSSAGASSR